MTVPIWLTLISAALPTLAADGVGDDGRVGDEDVVADELDAFAEPFGEGDPAVPVVFGEAVLDAPDREVLDQLRVPVDHVGGGEGLAVDVVGAVAVELAGGGVQGDRDAVAARGVPGGGDRLDEDGAGPLPGG